MPQEIHVVQCFSCLMYQTDIVKKATKKWTCKLCGEKQTIRKVFGQGSGKECRLHVQKLNEMKRINAENRSNMVQEVNHDKHEDEMLAVGNFDEFSEENLSSIANDFRVANNHTSSRQNEGTVCSYDNGNQESNITSLKESTCHDTNPAEDKPVANVLSTYFRQYDENTGSESLVTETVSKKRKMNETNICNGSSKWSHLLPIESDSEEDDQISYVHNHLENASSGAKRKNIFGDGDVDDLFDNS